MNKKEINRKGQSMTIWVILALVLILSIILFFSINKTRIPSSGGQEINPSEFIDNCVKKNVNEAVDIMLPQGGFIYPKNYKKYNNSNIEYICYNKGNYYPCISQHSMYLDELTTEIHNYANDKIKECFNELDEGLVKNKFAIDSKGMSFNVSAGIDNIRVNIQREMTVVKNEQTKKYNNFNVEIKSPLYNLANVAIVIANQEAKYCYFEYNGYMILYPRFDIRVTSLDDSTKIYSIGDKQSGKKLNIAIRGCAIPPGI
jgi:hypothetical protein